MNLKIALTTEITTKAPLNEVEEHVLPTFTFQAADNMFPSTFVHLLEAEQCHPGLHGRLPLAHRVPPRIGKG